jgi:hypothetical protein
MCSLIWAFPLSTFLGVYHARQLFGAAYSVAQSQKKVEAEFSEVELWIAYNHLVHGEGTSPRNALLQFHAGTPDSLKQVGVNGTTDMDSRLDTLMEYESKRVR